MDSLICVTLLIPVSAEAQHSGYSEE